MRTWLISVDSLWDVWASFQLYLIHATQESRCATHVLHGRERRSDGWIWWWEKGFVWCLFFVSERRYIRVAVMTKQERTKNAIRDNLKVTNKKLFSLWHFFFFFFCQKPATGHFLGRMCLNTRFQNNIQHAIYQMDEERKENTAWEVSITETKKHKKQNQTNSGCVMQTPPCFRYFQASFFNLLRDFFFFWSKS